MCLGGSHRKASADAHPSLGSWWWPQTGEGWALAELRSVSDPGGNRSSATHLLLVCTSRPRRVSASSVDWNNNHATPRGRFAVRITGEVHRALPRACAPKVTYCHWCKKCRVPRACWGWRWGPQDLSLDRQPGHLAETRPERRGLHRSPPPRGPMVGSEASAPRVFFPRVIFLTPGQCYIVPGDRWAGCA